MGQLQAIKVGDTRVVANNIRRIVTLTNDKLVKFDDGTVAVGMSGDMLEWFSDIEIRVYFSDDYQSYTRFYADEARDFLRQFDALTGIAEPDAVTDAVAEPVAAPETGALRDALPFLYTGGLEKLDEVLSKIIGSDAPVSAKSEAKILKQTVRKELNQRFDNLLKD